MQTKSDYANILLFLLMAMLLAGCSAISTPRLIAAYPMGEQPMNAPPVHPPPPQAFIYNALLGLEAWRPASAADRAEELAAGYSGYLISSHTWHQEGEARISIVLAVPVYNFEALMGELRLLGKLVSEQVWGEWQIYGPGGAMQYSQITIEIAPRGLNLPAIYPGGWNLGRTFTRALRVSTAIVRTLLDAAIWVLVIAAPFVLIALGVRFVIRKSRQ